MKLVELWDELQERAPENRDGRMVQRLHPEAVVDLFATVEMAQRHTRHGLELQVAEGSVTGVELPDGTREVDCFVVPRGAGRSGLVLALADNSARELFAAMCEDIAATTAACDTEDRAVRVWSGRFANWRRLLQGNADSLSGRRQRGLFAELLTIRDHLAPTVGLEEAVLAWKGPEGAPRDFELTGYAIEAKSSAANEPQIVPVHGERQLDDTGLVALVLLHFSLEAQRDAGMTLPALIHELRVAATDGPAAGYLEDRLTRSGYSDAHEPLYRRTGYAVRRLSAFHVRAGFPRITEVDLVDGIGSVRYALAIDACREFEIPVGFIADSLGGSA